MPLGQPGHLLRFTEIAQLPAVQQRHFIAGTGDIFNDMGREDHHSLPAEFYQQVAETDALPRVQPGGRLIDHQDARQVQQGLGNADPLFHPTGKSADFLVLRCFQMHRFQHVADARLPFPAVGDVLQDRLIIEELVGAHVFVGAEILGQIADQSLHFFPLLFHVDVVDVDCAIALLQDAADDAHQRGLAGAVGTQQAEHAALDGQGNSLEGRERLLAFAQHRDRLDQAVKPLADSAEAPADAVDIHQLPAQPVGGEIDHQGAIPHRGHDCHPGQVVPLPEKYQQIDCWQAPDQQRGQPTAQLTPPAGRVFSR